MFNVRRSVATKVEYLLSKVIGHICNQGLLYSVSLGTVVHIQTSQILDASLQVLCNVKLLSFTLSECMVLFILAKLQ